MSAIECATTGGITSTAKLLRVLCATTSLLAAVTGYAADKICANFLSPGPTIDGDLDADSGWIRANELTFNNGLPTQHGYSRVRMGTDFSNFYLSVRVQLDPEFNPEDVIILMFGPSGTTGTFQKIAIYPVDVAGAPTSGSTSISNRPKDVSYWDATSASPSLSWTSRPVPAWLQDASGNIRVMASSTAVSDKWYQIEMRLPVSANSTNGLVVPTSGDFRMYVNTIRFQPDPAHPGGSISPEVYWPQTAPITVGDVNNTPQPADWGVASLAGPCTGVHVTRAVTNNSSTAAVNVNSTNNIFTVDINNSGSDAAGRVQAELKAARFGLPGPGFYGHVPWPGNPMTTPAGISPGQTVTVSTLPWDLTMDPNRQQYINNSDLCSKVELTALTPANTLISNRVYGWNMYFSTASKFTHTAILDATGYPRRRDGRPGQQFVLNVFTADDLPRPAALERTVDAQAAEMAARQLIASMRANAQALNASSFIEKGAKFYTKFVCGYRRTGEFITIKGTKAEVVVPVNCYGYLLAHLGQIAEWQNAPLKGDGLTKGISPKMAAGAKPYEAYHAELQPGESMQLVTDVATADQPSQPGGKCSCGDVKCFFESRNDGGGTMLAGSLFIVGGVGVGGFAFLRRRKRKPEEVEERERQP